METWSAITSRRNVREFSDRDLADDDIERILEAARRAPSSRNAQWWDLVLVTDPSDLERLAGVWQGAWHLAGARAAVAIVAPIGDGDRQRGWIQYDLGQMTMQMMIAAADLGIGTGHAAVEDQDLARDVLAFPSDRHLYSIIPLGYPADGPLKPIANHKRRPFDEVVHRGRW